MNDLDQRYRGLVARPHDRERPFERPLSAAEMQLWQAALTMPRGFAVTKYALRLRGVLNVAAFTRAIEALTLRHEILRTTYFARDGAPVARVDPQAAKALTFIDCSDGGASAARAAFDHDRDVGFDLARAPLSRFVLCRVAGDEHWLCHFAHHIVCDWRSSVMFFRELSTLYDAYVKGEAATLAPPRLEYSDLVAWEQSWHTPAMEAAYEAFWRKHVGGMPVAPPVAHMRPRPRGQLRFRNEQTTQTLDAELSAAFFAFSKTQKVAIPDLLLAVLGAVLRAEGNDEAAIAIFSGNRRRETVSIAGDFTTIFPFRLPLAEDGTFAELVKLTRESFGDALRHRDLNPGFFALFNVSPAALGAAMRNGVMPLAEQPRAESACRVTLNYWSARTGGLPQLEGIEASEIDDDEKSHVIFDVEINVSLTAESRLHFFVEYNAELIDPPIMAAWLARFQSIMRAGMAAPQRTLRSLAAE